MRITEEIVEINLRNENKYVKLIGYEKNDSNELERIVNYINFSEYAKIEIRGNSIVLRSYDSNYRSTSSSYSRNVSYNLDDWVVDREYFERAHGKGLVTWEN